MAINEEDMQIAIFKWAGTIMVRYPELKWLYHCPNGQKRDSYTASRLKLLGVKPGVLDLSLDVARGQYHGFKLELKKPGGKCLAPSKEQQSYIEFATAQGYFCAVSNDFNECKKLILDYLNAK